MGKGLQMLPLIAALGAAPGCDTTPSAHEAPLPAISTTESTAHKKVTDVFDASADGSNATPASPESSDEKRAHALEAAKRKFEDLVRTAKEASAINPKAKKFAGATLEGSDAYLKTDSLILQNPNFTPGSTITLNLLDNPWQQNTGHVKVRADDVEYVVMFNLSFTEKDGKKVNKPIELFLDKDFRVLGAEE